MTTNIEKARVMLWTAGGLLVSSVGATGVLVWNVSQFVASERDAQADRMALLRSEMAEIGDAVSVQAVEMKWIRDLVTEMRGELRRQESNTASELREIRADIRSLNGEKHNGGNK